MTFEQRLSNGGRRETAFVPCGRFTQSPAQARPLGGIDPHTGRGFRRDAKEDGFSEEAIGLFIEYVT